MFYGPDNRKNHNPSGATFHSFRYVNNLFRNYFKIVRNMFQNQELIDFLHTSLLYGSLKIYSMPFDSNLMNTISTYIYIKTPNTLTCTLDAVKLPAVSTMPSSTTCPTLCAVSILNTAESYNAYPYRRPSTTNSCVSTAPNPETFPSHL